jgi:UPF0755 protein
MKDDRNTPPVAEPEVKHKRPGLSNIILSSMIKVLVGLFITGAAVAVWQYMDYKSYINSPEPALQSFRTIEIKPGMSFDGVAEMLRAEGIISNRTWFKILADRWDATTRVQAGQYTFRPGMAPRQMLDMIIRGDVTTLGLSVPEGFDIYDIAERVGKMGPWSEEKFIRTATSKAKARQYGVPVSNLEGYLFPAVYELKMSMTEEEIIDRMVKRGQREATAERMRKANELGFTWHQVLTLASLVQKETATNREMETIAGVFKNRLEKNMMLQCDPTAVYGDGDFKPPIKKTDLARATPYNTYLHFGLPPGPICNPGVKAIEAALSPEKHNYLYFVATGEGGHNFAENLWQHRKNVWKYRKKLREQKKGS